jgi:hypothetical protein
LTVEAKQVDGCNRKLKFDALKFSHILRRPALWSKEIRDWYLRRRKGHAGFPFVSP